MRRVTEVAGPHDPVSVRRVLLDDFEPGLAPDERCRRFLALPEHEWRVLWTDLAEAEAERPQQERPAGLHHVARGMPIPAETK